MPVETGAASQAVTAGVVLCTYNGAAHLNQQLDSILGQSVRVDELVISDDASTDATVAMLHAFSVRAQNMGIRVELVLRAENVGFVRNFSEALRRSTADVVFLCDQDDVWHRQRVDVFLRRFVAEPGLMLLHGDARLVDDAGMALGDSLAGALRIHPAELEMEASSLPLDALLVRNLVTGAASAMRRHVIDVGLPIAPGWVHDEWLGVVAAIHGQLGFVSDPLVDYRQHHANQIGAKRESFGQRWRRMQLFSAPARQQAALRFSVLSDLLESRKIKLAPSPLKGLPALCWRIGWSRLRIYRRGDVSWRWIAYDVPNMLVRLTSASLGGGGLPSFLAAARGAWTGWRGGG